MKKKSIIIVSLVVVIILGFLIYSLNSHVTVTFDYNDGGEVEKVKIKKNTTIDRPKDPTKQGYEFLSWMLDDEEFDFSTAISENITLVANYEKVVLESYTISFDTDGGSLVEDVTNNGNTITKLPEPTKEGYTFLGWYNGDTKVSAGDKINSDMSLIAKWEKQEEIEDTPTSESDVYVSVTFNSNGGSKVNTIKVKKDSTVNKPKDPTKEGYKFLGWYLNNKLYAFGNKVSSNIELVAKWEKQEEEIPVSDTYVTVTFNSNGGSKVDDIQVKTNSTVNKPNDPTKEGYKFLGWYKGDVLYTFDSNVTTDIELVAKWEKESVLSYSIEAVPGSIVGEVMIYITKDGVKTAGTLDIVTTEGTYNVSIPVSGYKTNKNIVKEVKNIKTN